MTLSSEEIQDSGRRKRHSTGAHDGRHSHKSQREYIEWKIAGPAMHFVALHQQQLVHRFCRNCRWRWRFFPSGLDWIRMESSHQMFFTLCRNWRCILRRSLGKNQINGNRPGSGESLRWLKTRNSLCFTKRQQVGNLRTISSFVYTPGEPKQWPGQWAGTKGALRQKYFRK